MQTISLPDTQLTVDVRGSGTPLLLVHGFPFHHGMWQSQLENLSRVCQVIAPDLRGFGSSEVPPPDSTLSMERFADDLAALLDHLVVDEVVYCGLSMGGYIGWAFCRSYPQRLKGLIACDTLATPDTEEAAAARQSNAQKVMEAGPEFLVEGMIPKLFGEKSHQTNPAAVEQVEAMIRNTAPVTIAAALRGMAERPDSTELLPTIQVPTLVVCGSDDVISPPDKMKTIAEAVPHSSFLEIPDAGHLSPLEQPGVFNQAVSNWLTTL